MWNQSGRTLGRQRLEESTAGSKSERPVRAYLGQIYRNDYFLLTLLIVSFPRCFDEDLQECPTLAHLPQLRKHNLQVPSRLS